MTDRRTNVFIAASLVFAVFLWGGNNAGTKFVVSSWPPVWTGGSRFLCAGLLLLGLLRVAPWLGRRAVLTPELRRRLWFGSGLSLAAYIVTFNWAVRWTAVSHVALYLGASPVWALLWEGRPDLSGRTFRRYGAALLALIGVVVLFWPVLKAGGGDWRGEVLGLGASVLWTHYGRQCRALGSELSGAATSAHTMWRAGVWLMPLAVAEVARGGLIWRTDLALVQSYCIIAGGVAAFAIWSNALRHWPTSQVLLFNNLIPLSTMSWAHVWLGEPVTAAFWLAMALVVAGVVIGQAPWENCELTRRAGGILLRR